MLFIKTIQLSKKKFIQNRIVLLFDTTTTSPCLYPLLYSLTALRFQSFATQQSDMLAIKLWYEFWFLKYSTLFCESFFSSGYTPEVYMHEIDNFIVFLENNKKLEMNLIRLRSNTNVNYKTITQRLRSVIKFFVFLLDEYWNIRNQDLTIKEITSHRKKIDRFLLNKKKIFGKFSQRSLTIKNTINHSFKSLSNEMVANLYEVIRPDQKNKTNPNNPFSTQPHQLRNFLIIHLMLNYGLRVGELMLLTEKSIKKSINSDSYSLIVTNTDDENDTRMRKPSIKNEQSYRVIKLNQKDYNFLIMYINYIRSCGESDILFTSLKPPYSPLSYSAINIIFNKIDKVFRYLHPIYFDNNKVDSIHKITPHVCRHTWAYITLAFAIKKYQAKGLIDNDENMQQAQENLRVLGGWSVNSVMPSYYAKRFIVDSANLLNLKRISEELLEL